ncbi:Protein MIZU-KUSSEI 1 [Zea mays]|uniref:Protein MIZU-KUSSEI 1 n=1 Tax=Zea mays TaxID=4577 RepID=A0A3L6E6D3_MAIZE|nr:Protein MIZU-KUSSEI 1 [Zea mays]
MRTIGARNTHDSLSFSRRHFKWPVLGKSKSHGAATFGDEEYMKSSEAEDDDETTMAFSSACPSFHSDGFVSPPLKPAPSAQQQQVAAAAAGQRRRMKVRTAVSRLRSALANAVAGRHRQVGMGARLTGTLYGHRRGHVHLAFQVDPRACPALLLELAAPTAALVREMASGLVRIALECDRARARGSPAAALPSPSPGAGKRLVEETVWRAYCNGKSCGYAVRRECGAADWRVLRALEPVSMGAGVIPAASCGGGEGDVMYMRARFERVVGSRDSEAFYMMNPDGSGGGGGHGGPELSVYLLRV